MAEHGIDAFVQDAREWLGHNCDNSNDFKNGFNQALRLYAESSRAQAASDKAEIARLVEENAAREEHYRACQSVYAELLKVTGCKDGGELQDKASRATRAEALAARYRADIEKLREALAITEADITKASHAVAASLRNQIGGNKVTIKGGDSLFIAADPLASAALTAFADDRARVLADATSHLEESDA